MGMLLRWCSCTAIVAWATIASGTIINFESPVSPPNPPPGYGNRWLSLITDGFRFDAPGYVTGPGGFTVNTTGTNFVYSNQFAGNNSNFIGTDGNTTWISMARLDGEPFTLRSFQATQIWNDGFSATTLRLTALDDHGAFRILDLGLDPIADGNGGLEDFETFTLTDPFFSEITRVYFEGRNSPGPGRFLLDNVVVPEPGTAPLLLGALLIFRLRATKQ